VNEVSIESLRGLPEYLRLPLHRTLEGLARALNTTASTVEEGASGEEGLPRVTPVLNALGAPFLVNAAEHAPGTIFDDVGAVAATEIKLPSVAEAVAAGFVSATECLHYRVRNTSGFAQRVRAAAGTTIRVDESTASTDGGYVENLSSNGSLHLALFDDQWRSESVTGEWVSA
jgi:hypothetical protein